jgi:hypothetical protein
VGTRKNLGTVLYVFVDQRPMLNPQFRYRTIVTYIVLYIKEQFLYSRSVILNEVVLRKPVYNYENDSLLNHFLSLFTISPLIVFVINCLMCLAS